jgi:hypothetical protein
VCAAHLARSWLQRGRAAEALELSRQSSGPLGSDDALILAQLAVVESEAHLALTRHQDAAEAAQRALTLSAGCGHRPDSVLASGLRRSTCLAF